MELEKLRLKNKELPRELDPDQIVLAGKLLDPFSGEPYIYNVVEGDTYQIYSVGPNGEDEGGLLKKRTELGDWVWRLNLPDSFDRESYESS